MSIGYRLAQWIAETGWATSLRESEVAFPAIQTVHIVGLGLLAGTIAIVDLRLLGVVLRDQPAGPLARRMLPLTWAGFAVMVTSGSLLLAAQAERIWQNIFLQTKLVLLVLAGLNMALFHLTTYRRIASWGAANTATPTAAKASAAASLLLWAAIITTGRLVAYFN